MREEQKKEDDVVSTIQTELMTFFKSYLLKSLAIFSFGKLYLSVFLNFSYRLYCSPQWKQSGNLLLLEVELVKTKNLVKLLRPISIITP